MHFRRLPSSDKDFDRRLNPLGVASRVSSQKSPAAMSRASKLSAT